MGHVLLAHLEMARGRWGGAATELERAGAQHEPCGIEYGALMAATSFHALPEDVVGAARDRVRGWEAEPRRPVLATAITDTASADDPNVVKLVCDRFGEALYFSRSEIPFMSPRGTSGGMSTGRSGADFVRLRHIGVYGFDRSSLLEIPNLPSSGLAEAEGLEQLRFLENGTRIRVLITSTAPWGIESPADYSAFLARVRGSIPNHS